MGTPLRVLIVEQSAADAARLVEELQRGGFTPLWERVATAAALRAALSRQFWDVVIAAYALAHFDAPSALGVLRESGLDVPFLIVAEHPDEDAAIAALRVGAHDYLHKDDLKRLVAAVERELREVQVRRERTGALAALRQSEESVRAIVDTAVDGIITVDERGLIGSFNPAAERMFGYRAEGVIGRNVSMLMPSPDRERHDTYLANYLRTGEKKIIGIGREVVGRRQDGTVFPMDLAVSELRRGTQWIFTGLVRDITDRKEAEEALRRERDFAESLLQTAQVIVLLLDPEGRILRFNPYMEEVSGYRLAEVQGRDWFAAFLPQRDQQRIRGLFSRILAGAAGQGTINPIVTKDGTEREIEWHDKTLVGTHGQIIGVLCIGHDITERRQATRRLAAQYAVTRVLAESTTLREAIPKLLEAICQGAGWDLGEIWQVDADAGVLRWGGLWHVPGIDPDEFLVCSRDTALAAGAGLLGGVWSSGQPAWIADVVAGLSPSRTAAAARLGLRAACAFPVRNQSSVIGVMSFFSHEVRPPDPQLLRMLDALGQQIGDFIARRRAEAELRELLKRTQQHERLADIGAITAQIVHDVGNPLAGISMQAQLVLRRAARDSGQPVRNIVKQVEAIFGEAQRLNALIKEFMEFSGEQRLRPRPLHVPHFLAQVIGLWQPVAAAHDIALTLHLPENTPPLTADEDKLRRVFENLVKNALEAIANGPGRVAIHVVVPEPEKIRISIEDTGPGLAKGLQLFRLFETTKPQGTGLGLAIAKQIVLAHGGRIEYAAREPHGTVFHVELPANGRSG